jgi:glycosyltransferase involved in cell wall biosynthesis
VPIPEAVRVSQYTSRLQNGAGIAAMRLHDGLREIGVDSRLYFGKGSSEDPLIKQSFQKDGFKSDVITRVITGLQARMQADRGDVRNPGWWVKARALPRVSDVVHIHSLFRWVDLVSLFNKIPKETPIVWSLHDFEPISGGCIYMGDCTGLEAECGACPQLRSGVSWIAKRNHKLKQRLFQKRKVHFVANSNWTFEQASKSTLGRLGASISMIHLGLDVQCFRPIDKATARKALGLPLEKPLLGFAATDLQEPRKGLSILVGAVNQLDAGSLSLLSFGHGNVSVQANHIHLGAVYSTELQRLFYSALDVFVTPSLLETFGNTAMEAMACGTPVVGYATSGLKDVVASGTTGILVDAVGDCDALTGALVEMIGNPERCREMSRGARRRVLDSFDVKVMANRYATLYKQLLCK